MKYRAVRGFAYPCAEDLPRVLEAGGMSRLDDDELPGVLARRVEVAQGQVLDDPPGELLEGWLERGLVEPVGFEGRTAEPRRFYVEPDISEEIEIEAEGEDDEEEDE